jgi:hypothetical protein
MHVHHTQTSFDSITTNLYVVDETLNDGNLNIVGSISLGPVYTMDREVGPWKMALFHGVI